jgi:hypothetical protein
MSESARSPHKQLPVVQPTAAAHRTRPLTVAGAALAMVAIVVVVLYGMTRPSHQQQATSAPVAASQTGQSPAETTGAAPSGQAGAPPQSGAGSERATSGQGGTQAGSAAGPDNAAGTTADQNRGQQSQTSAQPPASADSASGTTSGPNARPTRPPAPPAR